MEVIDNHPIEKKNTIAYFMPLVLLVLFIALFFNSFEGLFARWIKWDEGLSHGLLVNAVFIYFLYTSLPWQAHSNRKIIVIASHLGLGFLSILWFVFRIANIYILEQLLLLVLLIGFYTCSYGIRNTIKHRLLLLLPIFTIPVWEQLTDSLVNLSGAVVGKMVQLANMPAVIEGNSIFIPYGHIVIADGCSGLRYFEIALALAYIISLLNRYTEKRLLPTLLIAATLGLIANWIRIFVLVIIGYQTKMQSSLMANHEYFGWVLFGLMCLPAIYFAPIVKASPVKTLPEQLHNTLPTQKPRIIAPLCVLAIGPLLSFFITAVPVPATFDHVLADTSKIASSVQMPVKILAPENSFKEKSVLSIQDDFIYAEVDQYQRINQNDKLVPYINRLYNNEEWVTENSTAQLKNKSNTHFSAVLTKFRHKTSGQEILQLQWFEVGGYKTHSLAIAKILQIPTLISGTNNFKIITVQTHCDAENCTAAQTRLLDNLPAIFSPSQLY